MPCLVKCLHKLDPSRAATSPAEAGETKDLGLRKFLGGLVVALGMDLLKQASLICWILEVLPSIGEAGWEVPSWSLGST